MRRKWKLVPAVALGQSGARRSSHVSGSATTSGVLVTTKKIAGVTVHSILHTEAAYVVDATGYQRAIFLWPYSAAAVMRTLERSVPSS